MAVVTRGASGYIPTDHSLELANQIPRAEQLVAVFGKWPSFHDAEVVWLRLDRQVSWRGHCVPIVETQIHVFEMTSEVDANRYYVLCNHVLVHLRFFQVDELQLEGFNLQNVLDGLDLIKRTDAETGESHWEVRFPSAYGMHASFRCAAIEVVSVVPCNKEGEPSSSSDDSSL